ncbi:D-alanyl-D-alanine dipeptidase [Desulfonatronum thiosulfatophilum]|uniref:D-alanyl-D-alanine dipeptidase n=1 Tax=Desulfonatronum thiosulfatophilum TaxID=617002 RepID=A0A1G6ET72_9BACT|nr:M15 family metallopeptidase [Desulfonatronum thiosulfatophilum]SDB60749.1 D-alanyl-D-alanine dipeptidase [Desulfonatronum thiosulfatophilum]
MNIAAMKNSLTYLFFFWGAWLLMTVAAASVAQAWETDLLGEKYTMLQHKDEIHSISPLELKLIKEGFVDVQNLDPSILVDLKYARDDNFMGASAYGDFTRAYLRPEPSKMLVRASAILQERHPDLRILVGDALRPRSIQHKMWKLVVGTSKQHYVANPFAGSMHNYGAAVDVTLVNVRTGEKFDMGTPMDHFGPLSQPRLEEYYLQEGELTKEQIANRRILRSVMVDAGWHPLEIEWWHYDAFAKDVVRKKYSIIE